MKIRQIKLDLLYEYIYNNAPLSIAECVQYYFNVCSVNKDGHITRAYKQLYVLRRKGLITISSKVVDVKKTD